MLTPGSTKYMSNLTRPVHGFRLLIVLKEDSLKQESLLEQTALNQLILARRKFCAPKLPLWLVFL